MTLKTHCHSTTFVNQRLLWVSIISMFFFFYLFLNTFRGGTGVPGIYQHDPLIPHLRLRFVTSKHGAQVHIRWHSIPTLQCAGSESRDFRFIEQLLCTKHLIRHLKPTILFKSPNQLLQWVFVRVEPSVSKNCSRVSLASRPNVTPQSRRAGSPWLWE